MALKLVVANFLSFSSARLFVPNEGVADMSELHSSTKSITDIWELLPEGRLSGRILTIR